jgi:hypothetical protein
MVRAFVNVNNGTPELENIFEPFLLTQSNTWRKSTLCSQSSLLAIMSSYSSAARTNLTSQEVSISNHKLGEGAFRICLEGTYIGGNRNQQEAACKRFKPQFRQMEDEYFRADFRIADRSIEFAEEWNDFCDHGDEILVSRGDIKQSNSGIKYLVEPLIRFYTKFTSNTGWIADEDEVGWPVLAMEAFSHFSYEASGGDMIVCDLQGRHRNDRNKRRFELTDPAICSRSRSYGPTDLGEKGIDNFFSNHRCNEYCQDHWMKPKRPHQWFPMSHKTSMLSSRVSAQLRLGSSRTFRMGNNGTLEEEDSDDDY